MKKLRLQKGSFIRLVLLNNFWWMFKVYARLFIIEYKVKTLKSSWGCNWTIASEPEEKGHKWSLSASWEPLGEHKSKHTVS